MIYVYLFCCRLNKWHSVVKSCRQQVLSLHLFTPAGKQLILPAVLCDGDALKNNRGMKHVYPLLFNVTASISPLILYVIQSKTSTSSETPFKTHWAAMPSQTGQDRVAQLGGGGSPIAAKKLYCIIKSESYYIVLLAWRHHFL